VPLLCAFIIALTASDVLGFRIYLYFVAIMAGNAASHIRGTIQMRQYCPGLVSGSLLLMPLLVVGYWYSLGTGKVDLLSASICLCVGVFFGFYVYGMDIREKDRKKV